MVAFCIAITSLKKNIKLDLSFSKFVVKPIIATLVMGICSYFVFLTLLGIIPQKLATIVAIVIAVVIYVLAIIALKVFSKEEVLMIPYGEKVVKILEKLKIY